MINAKKNLLSVSFVPKKNILYLIYVNIWKFTLENSFKSNLQFKEFDAKSVLSTVCRCIFSIGYCCYFKLNTTFLLLFIHKTFFKRLYLFRAVNVQPWVLLVIKCFYNSTFITFIKTDNWIFTRSNKQQEQ